MWISSALLLPCLLRAALAQSVWEDVIEFNTKGTKDDCYMSVMGQGDLTKLRVTCQGTDRSYWCEYAGKPQVCRSYNKNQVHYFRQIMWDLRKLSNACQGQRVLKPLMCKRASDEARMVFTSSSSSDAVPRAGSEPMRPPAKTQAFRPTQIKPNRPKPPTQRRRTTPKPTEPEPTSPAPTSESQRLARDYCWRSLRGACSFVIGLFRS